MDSAEGWDSPEDGFMIFGSHQRYWLVQIQQAVDAL